MGPFLHQGFVEAEVAYRAEQMRTAARPVRTVRGPSHHVWRRLVQRLQGPSTAGTPVARHPSRNSRPRVTGGLAGRGV